MLDPLEPPSSFATHWSEAVPARGSRSILLVAGITVVGYGIHSAGPVLLPILFGALFAAAAQPLVQLLEARRIPRSISVLVGLIAMLVVLAAAGGTMFFGAIDLLSDSQAYSDGFASLHQSIVSYLQEHDLRRVAYLVQRQSAMDLLPKLIGPLADSLYRAAGFATLAGLVMFFGLTERETLLARLPKETRSEHTWSQALIDTQRYLAVKITTSVATGLLAGALCFAFGMPSFALWGAIAFWLNFVPVIGSLIAAVPPVFVALVTRSPEVGMLIALGYLVINMVIGNIIEPRWHGAAVGLSPLVVIIAIALWGGLLGPLGALIAVPLTMVLKLACLHTKDLAWIGRLVGKSNRKPRSKNFFRSRGSKEQPHHHDTLVSAQNSWNDVPSSNL